MLMLSIMLLLCSNAVAIRRDKSILYSRSAIVIILCCVFICVNSYYTPFIGRGIGLFSGLYQATLITHIFHIFIFIITGLILQLNSFHARKIWVSNMGSIYTVLFCKIIFFNRFILNKMGEQYRIIEYPLIILFVVMGGGLLMSSCDLITIFLSIELQSYGLYILCAIYRNSEQATTGGLMYFLLGGLSSCFILLGASLLYGNSGNTSFDGLYVINNISNSVNSNHNIESIFNSWYDSYYIHFCLAILSVGFLFKISAAPFHFWSPDVYDAIPTIVTTFVAIFAKISILVMLLELVHYTTNIFSLEPTTSTFNEISYTGVFGYSWTSTILVSSLLSLIIGAVLGLTQVRIKRLYAYSTISHIGFILLALAINSVESIQSFIFYIMQYSLSNLNAFLLLIAIGYSLYVYVEEKNIEKEQNTGEGKVKIESKHENDNIDVTDELLIDKNNSPIQLIKQLKGYFYINPVLSLSLAITIFSFVGIPPLVGFFAKQMILSSAIDSGYVFMALIAILTSVISAYYYLAIVKQIFFDKSDYVVNPSLKKTFINASVINYNNFNVVENLEVKIDNIKLTSFLSTTISILSLVILLFILVPQEWLSMANILALILFND